MYDKLLEIQGMRLEVKKEAEGYNYKYATLDQVWDVLQPILQKEKILVLHITKDNQVCTQLRSGEDVIESCMPLPDNLDPQKLGSAVTYYRRYNLLQLFNIMTDDDDDGAAAKPAAKKKAMPSHIESNDDPLADI